MERSLVQDWQESGLQGQSQLVQVVQGTETELDRDGERKDQKVQCQLHPLLFPTCQDIPDGSSRHKGLPSVPAEF